MVSRQGLAIVPVALSTDMRAEMNNVNRILMAGTDRNRAAFVFQHLGNSLPCNQAQPNRDCIADLAILFGGRAEKAPIKREFLNRCALAHSQCAHLIWVAHASRCMIGHSDNSRRRKIPRQPTPSRATPAFQMAMLHFPYQAQYAVVASLGRLVLGPTVWARL